MAISKEKMLEIANGFNGRVVDDHTAASDFYAVALALLTISSKDGTSRHHLVPLQSNVVQCVNPLYNKDGVWHMSTGSVSGNIDTTVGVETAVAAFNEEYVRHGGDFSGDMHHLELISKF